MDSNSDDVDYQILDQDRSHFRVTYTHARNTKGDYNKNEESTKKRLPVSRSGNNPSRMKRVVSCKRKTHHLTVARKKLPASGKAYVAANKENETDCKPDMEPEILSMDPWDLSHVEDKHQTGRTGPEQSDYRILAEIARDHSSMTTVLFGRNLRLKVAFTLWQRNVGELLTYFLRIQDPGVLVDFLPLISKSINEDSPTVSIGCCVDLFPLVKKVLANPYEEYLIVGLQWIGSVLKNWWEELRESGLSGSPKRSFDKNFQIFNQQLVELWLQEPSLKSAPGSAGDMVKVIDSFLSQLSWQQ